MVKEIDVVDIRGRKRKTKVFTTRQEADDILDTLHGFKNKGRGWWGDSPGHRKARLKAERKGAIDKPIKTRRARERGLHIGSRIQITSDNENYDPYRHKTWVVEDIATSREEHPGYDEGVGGNLISCKGLPFSLYDYEFEEV